jgi:predicted nuclease of restriction endonuclease-like (RecB) superfamily
MKSKVEKSYLGFIAELKQSILKSRLQAARLANREMLLLYLSVGFRLSEKIKVEKWGAKILQQIADDLQAELPGLRGFSVSNLKNMRQFADEYVPRLFSQLTTGQIIKLISQSPTGQLPETAISPLATGQTVKSIGQSATAQSGANTITPLPTAISGKQIKKQKRPLPAAQLSTDFTQEQLTHFFSISFTHHILLLNKCAKQEQRFFYMQLAATQLLSVEDLAQNIKAGAYKKRGKLPNNFAVSLPEKLKATALDMFKDEYLFDFMQLDDEEDERVFETKLVANIKKFIMSLGKGYSFIGNQYKLELEEREYAADLLFFNRILQCLVVFELKRGRFKPEYAGKLNFYLNLLDDKVKLPHENPSIGIILCKEKNNTEVEYSFKNINKAMGVATYKLSSEVPKAMKGILPDAATLKKLLK